MNYLMKKESRPKNSTGDDENSNNGLTRKEVAVAAATGVAALAVLGISQWLRSSEPEPKRQEKTMLISSSSSSSSRGVRDQNRSELNNIMHGLANREGERILGDGHMILEGERRNSDVKWTRPKRGCFKLNTDARVSLQPWDKTGPAYAGGVIRNDAGEWIVGFTSTLGECDITEAELEAVKEGLHLALKLGYWRVEVETDSEAAVKLINEHNLRNGHNLTEVVEDCRELLRRLNSDISHVYRGGNECADALAKLDIPGDKKLEVWKNVPDNKRVRDVVENDMNHSRTAHYVLGTTTLYS